MVKTRPNKKPNKQFENDFVHTNTRKVTKKKKSKKPTRQLRPRGKKGISSLSSDSGPDLSVSPTKKRKTSQETEDKSNIGKALTIVFARKVPPLSITGKKGKSKKSHKSKISFEDDLRSTSANFKRKGMDRPVRPDSPTRGVDEIDRIKLAIDEIKTGVATSVQKAAYKWRVHADKLYRRLKGSVRIDGRNGPPPVLSRAEEDKLTTWINTMSERGFPVSSGSLRNTVQNFLKQDKRENPFTDDKPSMSWYKAFVRRNPKVKIVSSMMLTRSHKSTEAVLDGWFGELDTFLRCLDIIDKPEKIWHFVAIDLSATSSTGQNFSNGSTLDMNIAIVKDKVCTCIVCGNAAGHVIPPFFVFRGHSVPSTWDPLVGSPLSSGQLFTQMGSSSKTMYSDWLENHFLPNIGPDRPIALLLDCPEGHIDVDVFVTAQQNDVHMFRILPLISDIVCPIPEDMLRVAWEREAALWNKSHPLVPVSVKNAARIVGKAWPKIDQPGVIVHNFRKVGVYPVNRDVIQDLLLDKFRKDREMEEASRIASLKPAQSMISLELFESKLDSEKKEKFHLQLLSKESDEETQEYREWKELYEEVYGKIIPVQDVPIAEEEVIVSYVEHVVDPSNIFESEINGNPVTVEVKQEFEPSQIIFSSDISSVPADVINVALTMATDIATYRTESDLGNHGYQVPTSIPISVANETVVVTSDLGIPQVQDGGEIATTVQVVDAPGVTQPSLSSTTSSTMTVMPSVTTSRHGGLNQTMDTVPVSKKAHRKQTTVNVIRITPGEKRDVSQSNIAVHRSPVSLGASKMSASGILQQVAMAASGAHASGGQEEILPLIHISDTGEVSVVPADGRKEIVEVTDVIEVESSDYQGVSAEDVLQQIQVAEVTEMEAVEDVMPKETMMETNPGGTEVVTDTQVEATPLSSDVCSGAESKVAEADNITVESEEEFLYNVSVVPESTNEEIPLIKAEESESIEMTTLPHALNASAEVSSIQEVVPEVSTVSSNDQVMKNDTVQSIVSEKSQVVEVIQGAVMMEGQEGNQATIVTETSDNTKFDGPGNVPLMQGDVVMDEIPTDTNIAESTPDNPADVVLEVRSVTPVDTQCTTEEPNSVTLIVEKIVTGDEELSEVITPSDDGATIPEAVQQDGSVVPMVE